MNTPVRAETAGQPGVGWVDAENDPVPPETAGFTVTDCGPWDAILERLHLRPIPSRMLILHAVAPAIVVWLPLLVIEGLRYATRDPAAISFFQDLSVHVRFLIVVPLLVLSEWGIARQTRICAAGFAVGNLVRPEDRARFLDAVNDVRRIASSPIAEVAIAVAVMALMIVVSGAAQLDGMLFWYERGTPLEARLTGTGLWYMAGSAIPLFLILRWGWRYLAWCLFLFRVSRLQLLYLATHPDRAGGIGFVGIGHTPFALIGAGVSCLLTAAVGTRILHLGATFKNFQIELAAIVVIITAIGLAPLLVFLPGLVRARRRGLLQHGEFSTRFVRDAERKMRESRDGTSDMKDVDIQSLADIGGSYERVREMRLVPIDLMGAAVFVLAAGLPMLVLILTNVPFDQVLRLVMSAIG